VAPEAVAMSSSRASSVVFSAPARAAISAMSTAAVMPSLSRGRSVTR
jgi:hypothetical protein